MKSEKRGGSKDEGAVDGAFETLAAFPGLSDDPRAARALETLAASSQPDRELAKVRRLADATRVVSSSLDVEAVLQSALELAVQVMRAERGFLMLREGRRIAAVHDLGPFEATAAADAPSHPIVERVLTSGEPVFTTDAQSDPKWNKQRSIVALHIRSIACVPLRVRSEIIGLIYLDSRVIPGLFQPVDREVLVSFAHQAALAIENARLFGKERERAQRIAALQDFQDRLLETIASGVFTIDGSRRITSFNRAAETTFGVTSQQMVFADSTALTTLVPDFPELIETFYKSGAVLLRAEVDAYRPSGTELAMQLRFTPLETPQGTGVAVVITDVTEQRKLEETHAAEMAHATAIQKSFSRYLAPHVVQSLVKDPSSVRLGGERKYATMLFADIRGFTALAATLEAERVVEILNTYFAEAVRIIFEHDGLLDKFYGDGLMAVFGAPVARADDASRAVRAAIALQAVVRGHLATKLNYPLAISLGLASGDVVAGHIGSPQRMDYTVIGDAVNLAQGLQSASPPGSIYLDEATYAKANPKGQPFHRIAARIKGRAELVTAYALLPKTTLAAIGRAPEA